jgi:NAD(P)-dependent dehydrogenase (short-subunit alcohol dehydrogenase family)
MSRVALVTGGTRGIGAATREALKAAGYKVAANYGRSDDAAQQFKAETGIPVSEAFLLSLAVFTKSSLGPRRERRAGIN